MYLWLWGFFVWFFFGGFFLWLLLALGICSREKEFLSPSSWSHIFFQVKHPHWLPLPHLSSREATFSQAECHLGLLGWVQSPCWWEAMWAAPSYSFICYRAYSILSPVNRGRKVPPTQLPPPLINCQHGFKSTTLNAIRKLVGGQHRSQWGKLFCKPVVLQQFWFLTEQAALS